MERIWGDDIRRTFTLDNINISVQGREEDISRMSQEMERRTDNLFI